MFDFKNDTVLSCIKNVTSPGGGLMPDEMVSNGRCHEGRVVADIYIKKKRTIACASTGPVLVLTFSEHRPCLNGER